MRLLVCAMAIGWLATSFAAPASAHARDAQTGVYDAFYGDYSIGPNHVIGVNRFVDDAGKTVMLFADYQSGIVRRLFPASGNEFVMGPGFDAASPVELKARFIRGANSKVFGISLLPTRGAAAFAKRVPLRTENVTFFDGTDARAAERNARAALAEYGNKDFTFKIFPGANHALQEMPSRARMAPGVFETLRSWLQARMDPSQPSQPQRPQRRRYSLGRRL